MMNNFVMLVRREVWEHSTLKGLPLTLLVIVLLINLLLISLIEFNTDITVVTDGETFHSSNPVAEFLALAPAEQAMGVNGALISISSVISSIIYIMMLFYLLDSLYSERKDHSILFWKSLPISDTRTVLSKVVVAVALIPAIIFLTTLLAQLLTLLVQTLYLSVRSDQAGILWEHARLASLWGFSLATLLHQSIWYLPTVGWLLFCSAWSKKAPIIAAVLIPLFLMFIDGSMRLQTGMTEAMLERFPLTIVSVNMDKASQALQYESHAGGLKLGLTMENGQVVPRGVDLLEFFTNLKVWLGVLVGSLFVAAAVWLRRWHDDSL